MCAPARTGLKTPCYIEVKAAGSSLSRAPYPDFRSLADFGSLNQTLCYIEAKVAGSGLQEPWAGEREIRTALNPLCHSSHVMRQAPMRTSALEAQLGFAT